MVNVLIFQRLIPVLSLRTLGTSFIRLTASGIFDRRDHAVKKKIIHGATI